MNAYEFVIKMRNYASSGLQQVARELGVAGNQARQFDKSLKQNERSANSFGSALGGLKGKLIGLLAGISLMGLTQQVITARSEYEKFDAVLTNTFQSKEVGQGALAMLTDFAAKTPYQLNELTGGFIKLVNRGINPTYDEMTKIGDLASSQGKSFDQLVEGIMDAQTGEFERMKEFGIKAKKAGDNVSLSFKGVTKEVANNDKAIKDAIVSFGAMTGVAGSMDVISKTLGGRLSNLADNWWGFLVAVGGYGGGILGDFISTMDKGLVFLKAHLPQISLWFEVLFQNLTPVVTAIKNFFSIMFGFSGATNLLETFGSVMSGVLLVVGWFSDGLSFLINNISGIAPEIAVVTASVWAFNIAMAMSPIGWVILGIIALSTVIGMIMKYTDGWGKSWSALGNLIKLFWNQLKADFRIGIDVAVYHFNRLKFSAFEILDKIGQKMANVGQSIKQALELDFTGAFDTLNKEVSSQYTNKIKENESEHKNNLKNYANETGQRIKQAKKEVEDIGITVDTEGISKDFKKLKKGFSGIKETGGGKAQDYFNFLKDGKPPKTPGGNTKDKDKKAKEKSDGISGGGSRQTHITVNIGKLQDDTKIYVSSAEKGINDLGDKVQEMILRAVNSVNQMQTS